MLTMTQTLADDSVSTEGVDDSAFDVTQMGNMAFETFAEVLHVNCFEKTFLL